MNKNLEVLRCPACIKMKPSKLTLKGNFYVCINKACRYTYKKFNGIPVLLTNSGDYLNFYSENERNERKNKPTQKFTEK